MSKVVDYLDEDFQGGHQPLGEALAQLSWLAIICLLVGLLFVASIRNDRTDENRLALTADLVEERERLARSSAYTRSLLEAALDPFVTSPEDARKGYERVFTDGEVVDCPLELAHKSGLITPVLYNAAVYRDQDGEVIGVFAAARDITERRLTEDRLRRQSKEILELSTPVMQIWEGIVVVPLIGTLDSARTAQFMERLLDRIVETNSPWALGDITGVPVIDAQTAQHLIEAITAVRLLGAQVVLTGVRPAIAQTLVQLGVDLSGITTRSSMAAGIKVALAALASR